MTNTRKQFIIDTLLPYFEDPSTCAMGETDCMYRTRDGRKCAVGKHIRDDKYNRSLEFESADTILDRNGGEILTLEAQAQNLDPQQWQRMQNVHDAIAKRHSKLTIFDRIERLEAECDVELPELHEAAKSLKQ